MSCSREVSVKREPSEGLRAGGVASEAKRTNSEGKALGRSDCHRCVSDLPDGPPRGDGARIQTQVYVTLELVPHARARRSVTSDNPEPRTLQMTPTPERWEQRAEMDPGG